MTDESFASKILTHDDLYGTTELIAVDLSRVGYGDGSFGDILYGTQALSKGWACSDTMGA